MINISQLEADSEICQVSHNGGIILLAIGKLIEWCKLVNHPIDSMPITALGAEQVRAKVGGSPDARRNVFFPLVALQIEATAVLADGNHRYLRRFTMGDREAACWVVAQRDWHWFVIAKPEPASAGTVTLA